LIISVLNTCMLHAIELEIKKIGKYQDKSGYWAVLKNDGLISATVNSQGEIHCTLSFYKTEEHNEIEQPIDPEWFITLKNEYEKSQLPTSQEAMIRMFEDMTLK